MNNSRIEFIDLAKGICITLVVLFHCNIEVPYLHYIRMPLYFILSGLFFKPYNGFVDFLKRKINKILVPFLFFYLLSYAIYFTVSHFFPNVRFSSEISQFFFLDPWYSRICFNNPLWFLLSLFWCNILYFIIQTISSKSVVQLLLSILCVVFYEVIRNDVFLPLYLGRTLSYLPYFFVGTVIKRTSLLCENEGVSFFQRNKSVLMGLVFVVLFVSFDEIFKLTSNIVIRYICSITGVMALLLILKKIGKLPLLSYYGRYSIIILCTSHLIYSPLKVLCTHLISEWGGVNVIVFISTMLIEIAIIWLCRKFLPYVTAQRDLIPIQN